jgi:hypothetical protein
MSFKEQHNIPLDSVLRLHFTKSQALKQYITGHKNDDENCSTFFNDVKMHDNKLKLWPN